MENLETFWKMTSSRHARAICPSVALREGSRSKPVNFFCRNPAIFTYPLSRASMHEASNVDDDMPPCNNIDVESTMHDPSMHVEPHAEPNFEESQTTEQDIPLGGEAPSDEPIDHNINEQEPHDNASHVPHTAREKRNKSVPKRLQEYEVRLPRRYNTRHPTPIKTPRR
ncbi:hypothetical protein E3N88_14049 [Mikania micrantha]|uniref:Uncharacterized protein n=1 Tax=Mikania micrantha TaxID=192012 RepID=A0A5N6P0D3_9ASTR|nr:hypothetical protein E3N88_14049 [Mikania micrantha]